MKKKRNTHRHQLNTKMSYNMLCFFSAFIKLHSHFCCCCCCIYLFFAFLSLSFRYGACLKWYTHNHIHSFNRSLSHSSATHITVLVRCFCRCCSCCWFICCCCFFYSPEKKKFNQNEHSQKNEANVRYNGAEREIERERETKPIVANASASLIWIKHSPKIRTRKKSCWLKCQSGSTLTS